jgi:hypothetical protein
MSPFIPLRLLLTYIRRPPPPAQVANSHTKVFLFKRPLPLSLCFATFSLHPHRLHLAHGTGESRASRTSSCCWDPAWDRRAIRFLGSVFTRLLAPVQLLQLRTSEQLLPLHQRCALRSSANIDCVRLLLMVDYRIKVHMDLQADKSPVVVKGPFFPRVVNPRYQIRGTMCNARIQSSKARKAIF